MQIERNNDADERVVNPHSNYETETEQSGQEKKSPFRVLFIHYERQHHHQIFQSFSFDKRHFYRAYSLIFDRWLSSNEMRKKKRNPIDDDEICFLYGRKQYKSIVQKVDS